MALTTDGQYVNASSRGNLGLLIVLSFCLEIANIRVSPDEIEFLKKRCPYFNDAYLQFLTTFKLTPSEQIEITWTPVDDTGSDEDVGGIEYLIKGRWVETILYEIPLLALTSQAYFMFCDKDWDYNGQEDKAFRKGCALLEHGCVFSEFGSRRRRDYHTQDLVMKGLCAAAKESQKKGWKGVFTGSSNVHFAMKYDVDPVGTVAHEWYMTIAAITDDYENANEIALRYWLGCFGEGVSFMVVFLCLSNTLTSLGPWSRINRHIRYTSLPRCLLQANTRIHQRRSRCRQHKRIRSRHHNPVQHPKRGTNRTSNRGTNPRGRRAQEEDIRGRIHRCSPGLWRPQLFREDGPRLLRWARHYRPEGHRLLGLAQHRKLSRIQGHCGGSKLQACFRCRDILHQ